MGSGHSSANSRKWREKREIPSEAESSRVLFLLYLIHRTWNAVVEHVDSKNGRWRHSRDVPTDEDVASVEHFDTVSMLDSELGTCFSLCSCSYCQLKECSQDCISELTPLENMANCGGWSEEPISKEKQRPPIYNPEDYVTSLKKWGKKVNGRSIYELDSGQELNKSRTLPTPGSKDFRNPCLSLGEEMSLRQFGTPSELLAKLRADLRLSFPSFVQEFACEPLDGVTLLLELLRNIQLTQSGEGARGPPAVRRRPLLDELACLQCLWSCCSRYPDCVARLVAGNNGVYTLTVCIMSTVNKSRVLALQLLTKACYPPANGHNVVSEALSTLRLRYGEPVRFRFLVGMLQSAAGSGDLQSAGLAFINALLVSAPAPQRKLYIQAELEQAGFDIVVLKKMIAKIPNVNEHVIKEIENYEKQLIDIDLLSEKASEAQKEKDDLKLRLELLEKRVEVLQEEKGILLSLEQCLKEKCYELQEEVSSLRSEHGNSNRKKSFGNKKKINKRDESSPPEDEGISSSERSLSPEGDLSRNSLIYEVLKNEKYDLMRNKRHLHKKLEPCRKIKDHKKISDDEEETTIDEVIQELRNLVNDAESEQFCQSRVLCKDVKSSRNNATSETINSAKTQNSRNQYDTDKEDSITSTRHSIHITNSTEVLNETNDGSKESLIVPSKILPCPPRRAKSLIPLVPQLDQGLLYNKPSELYDDTYFSSDEGSDSLLSSSRYPNDGKKNESEHVIDFYECRAMFSSMTEKNKEDNRIKRSSVRSQEEICKPIIKRSESCQMSERSSKQREYLDIMFQSETNHAFDSETPIQRRNTKCSRVDEIVSLIESKKLTKSLDRIDEGLNSMVDIVMLPESKKSYYPFERRQRCSSQTVSEGNDGPLLSFTKSNTLSNNRFESKSECEESPARSESAHKFYLPQPKLSTGSFDNYNNTYNNETFLVRRGLSNAGMYSTPNMMRDAPASITSLVMNATHNHADLKRTLSPHGHGSQSLFGTNKLADMPSGLY